MFWIDGKINSVSYWIYMVLTLLWRQKESLVPEPGSFDIEITIENLQRYELRGNDQILADLIQAGGLHSDITNFTYSIQSKEELPQQ
jgi:hypothetical protein